MTLAVRLAAALSSSPDVAYLTGDHHDLDATPNDQLSPAAVLVAITDRIEPGVILTRRTETLRRHPGQIAFPGGRIDASDADAVAAALREAHEEIALPSKRTHVIGTADRYRTGTGFDVIPVIAVVPPDLPLVPAEAEVAEVFEVPLAFLLDPANHDQGSGEWYSEVRRFTQIDWQGYRIWGATAGIIVNLSRRLRWT